MTYPRGSRTIHPGDVYDPTADPNDVGDRKIVERQRDYWKHRAMEAEAQLGQQRQHAVLQAMQQIYRLPRRRRASIKRLRRRKG